MKTTENATTDLTSTATAPLVPKVPQTATITLTAVNGATLAIVAQRRRDNTASSFVITTGADKKASRGMTEQHPTFEAAKKAIGVRAQQAEKLGWARRVAGRGFVAKPDAFATLPTAPKAKK